MIPKDISIVIVNYNVKHFLQQCLESIKQSIPNNISVEIIVVDNDSVDGSVQMVEAYYQEVKLIVNDTNVGFSKANNQGISIAKGKYTLVVNPDTLLAEDTLIKCFRYMESNSDVVALGVKMIDGSGRFLAESKRSVPGLWNSFCKLSGLSKILSGSKIFDSYNLGWTSEDETQDVNVLCGAFMFCKTEILTQLGGFDEDYFMYGEDIDLSIRLSKFGRIVYYPETTIIHYKGESSKLASFNYVKQFYKAMAIFVRKNHRGTFSGISLLLLYLVIFFTGLISFVRRSSSTILRVLIECAVLWYSFDLLAKFWAWYYFKDVDYYQNFDFTFNKIIYISIWVISAWFFGVYDDKAKTKNALTGVVSGTALICLVYGLFPESLRSSRTLIIFGSVLAFGLFTISSYLFTIVGRILSKKSNNPRVVIVAGKAVGEKIKRNLEITNPDAEVVASVLPKFDARISQEKRIKELHKIVRGLKANEIIFSSSDLSFQEIIDHMTEPETKVIYRISSFDGEVILGSQSAKSRGEVFSIYSNFRLSRSLYRRIKLLTDILICIGLTVFFPILIWLINYRKKLMPEIIDICLGYKTWVGYRGDVKSSIELPGLKVGVLEVSCPEGLSFLFNNNSGDPDHIINYWYARWYSPFTDFSLVYHSLIGNTK